MTDSAKPMHQDFARWYHAVSMGDDAARRLARWEGVLNVVENADPTTVEALLRLAHGGRAAPAPATVQAIRQSLKDADDAFEMNGNERELQVLAGISLVILMEDLAHGEGAAAALAATTAGLGGARKPDLPMNLAALGEIAINRRGEANRNRPSLNDHVSLEPPKFDFEKAAAKVRDQSDWASVAEAFTLAAEGARAGMRVLAQRQARAIRAVDSFIRVQDEELQMLWWLTGQRSENYDCAFDAVPSDAQPFVLASELAVDTEILPGPPSVKAILSRAGLKERKKVAVTAAVNAPRTTWLQTLVEDVDPSPLSTPLHFAIKRQVETGPGEAWVVGWAASTGIDAAHALPGLILGELFYRERLLLLFR
jgi:hypothetical protein